MVDKPKEGETRRVNYKSGTVYYEMYINGMWRFHRLDGPALMYKGGSNYYFIEGKSIPSSNFTVMTSKLGRILYG